MLTSLRACRDCMVPCAVKHDAMVGRRSPCVLCAACLDKRVAATKQAREAQPVPTRQRTRKTA